jgi:DNA-binding response OmpR family regulator
MGSIQRKVLVVEDDTLLASLIKKSLIEVGFLVETAEEDRKSVV